MRQKISSIFRATHTVGRTSGCGCMMCLYREDHLSISYFHHISLSLSLSPSRGIRLLFHGLNFCWMEFSGSNAPNNTERTMITIPQMAKRKRKNEKKKRRTQREWTLCTETVTLVWRLMDGCVFSVCVDESGERTHSRTYHPYRNGIFFLLLLSVSITCTGTERQLHQHMRTRRIHFNLFFP